MRDVTRKSHYALGDHNSARSFEPTVETLPLQGSQENVLTMTNRAPTGTSKEKDLAADPTV